MRICIALIVISYLHPHLISRSWDHSEKNFAGTTAEHSETHQTNILWQASTPFQATISFCQALIPTIII